jgi:hypothetical protein
MESSQHTNVNATPDRASFFSIPENVRIWARFGATFWGGVLMGIVTGFWLTLFLVEFELVTRERIPLWLGLPAILVFALGLGITTRSVRKRQKQAE